jgi:hypothetical protein
MLRLGYLYKTQGSHDGEASYCGLPGYDTVQLWMVANGSKEYTSSTIYLTLDMRQI